MAELTRREREVLALIMQGELPKDIAKRLCIERVTVYSHLGRIYKKIGVHSRTQLLKEVIAN